MTASEIYTESADSTRRIESRRTFALSIAWRFTVSLSSSTFRFCFRSAAAWARADFEGDFELDPSPCCRNTRQTTQNTSVGDIERSLPTLSSSSLCNSSTSGASSSVYSLSPPSLCCKTRTPYETMSWTYQKQPTWRETMLLGTTSLSTSSSKGTSAA